jgi:hypothetical protein
MLAALCRAAPAADRLRMFVLMWEWWAGHADNLLNRMLLMTTPPTRAPQTG